ncbi:MAG: DUF6607 family protein [Congregibacter sp.]
MMSDASRVVAQERGSAVQGPTESTARQYTYAWMFAEGSGMKPRGGTSRGPAVTLDERVAPQIAALHEPGLEAQARDRRAILAMVGDYRTSFDFIETIGFTPGYQPRPPYQSWGTERVYLVADEPGFVSLQHIIVMNFLMDDGAVSEPMVVKHWRQDWRYEDGELQAFVGRNTWQKERLSLSARAGRWSQTVYQVDDSPRYEAVGRWTHNDGVSIWESEDRRRPLPRREFSVRSDYQALYGAHRISVYAGGWTQEEDTLKLALDESNRPLKSQPYLAREAGLSRYERIRDFDFSAGDKYWDLTREFWAAVRDYWSQLYQQKEGFELASRVEGTPMFMTLFELAERPYVDDAERQAAVERAIEPYIIR